MSKRPIKQKQIKRLERALRKAGSPPSSIDLIDWLKTRGHAQTTGAAVKLLLGGHVRIDSHVVGRIEYEDPLDEGRTAYAISPLVGAHHRGNIVVDD